MNNRVRILSFSEHLDLLLCVATFGFMATWQYVELRPYAPWSAVIVVSATVGGLMWFILKPQVLFQLASAYLWAGFFGYTAENHALLFAPAVYVLPGLAYTIYCLHHRWESWRYRRGKKVRYAASLLLVTLVWSPLLTADLCRLVERWDTRLNPEAEGQ